MGGDTRWAPCVNAAQAQQLIPHSWGWQSHPPLMAVDGGVGVRGGVCQALHWDFTSPLCGKQDRLCLTMLGVLLLGDKRCHPSSRVAWEPSR